MPSRIVHYSGKPSFLYLRQARQSLSLGAGKDIELSQTCIGHVWIFQNLEAEEVFFCIAESPVTFTTPGYRLYLKVREIQKEGPIIDSVKKAIAEHAGAEAAKGIAAGVVFDVTEIRSLVAMG